MLERLDQITLKRFEHAQKMDDRRINERIYITEMVGWSEEGVDIKVDDQKELNSLKGGGA